MSGFFGLVTSSLKTAISTSFISTGRSSTTSSISVTATNTGGGTLTYSWRITGSNATINTSSSSSTTVTGLGISGTTELYCNITNSVTGVTYPSPTCIITWAAVAPSAPTIGVSSSGDKSFTINWTAPTDDGGDTITGYYVQNSTNGGTTWSTAILVNDPLATSYNWSGNTVVYNGNTYIGRVAAVNSIGTGSYSGNSVGRVPTFAAPTINNIAGSAGYPSTASPFLRPFNITYTPTACVDYASTYIYIQYVTFESFGAYYASVNGGTDNLFTTITGQQTTVNINSVYAYNLAQGGQWYNTSPDCAFYAYAITYNNDGYGVQSATYTSFVTVPTQSYYTYNPNPVTTANALSLYTGGQFNINSGTYSAISGSITSNDWNIVKLNVSARTATLSSAYGITSGSRYFLLDYSFTTTATFTQVFNGNGTPFNAAGSAIGTRNTDVDITDTGFSGSGTGRIRMRGVGTFTAGTTIQANVTAYGQTRTLNYY